MPVEEAHSDAYVGVSEQLARRLDELLAWHEGSMLALLAIIPEQLSSHLDGAGIDIAARGRLFHNA